MMYGLLLESVAEFIKDTYGEEKWEEVRRAAGVEHPSFSTHQVYPENTIPRLVRQGIQILNVTDKEFLHKVGESFVTFVGQYGYDRVLSVLGRHMRDFLNGLDNLHEYLKFSYPRMRAPSFFCENESSTGLTLHYRSKRRGFVYYTMGLIAQVGKQFYNTDVEIELIKEEVVMDTNIVTFQLRFDNSAFVESHSYYRDDLALPIRSSVFLEIFPFSIVFGSDMTIRSIGNSLMQIMPQLTGLKLIECFDLIRPLIEFKFHTILNRTNNIFELIAVDHVIPRRDTNGPDRFDLACLDDDTITETKIRLKGQMMYMEDWKMIIFLGTPVMPDLDAMVATGLYINDLSMHDFSRDLMMAGTQQSVELKLALDQEQQKSKKLEESMKKLDEEMRRTDELLYQMIPKLVADRLRKGENPIDTCQVFESVTILFSDVVTFTEICSRISPMEVVSMLNAMYSLFDRLTEINGVYKVETIGDAYMVVGGAPVKDEFHADKICDMALDMVDAITDLKDPSTGQHLRIRVGLHTGTVVAGVVGLKMPRYCLFGDSVNTASRLESTSEAMKIHVSETTKQLLSAEYLVSDRGEITVKGKGNMKTYWLTGKSGRQDNLRVEKLNMAPLSAHPDFTISRGYSPVTMEDVAKKSHVGSLSSSPAHLIQPSFGVAEHRRRSLAEMEQQLEQTSPEGRKSHSASQQLPNFHKRVAVSASGVSSRGRSSHSENVERQNGNCSNESPVGKAGSRATSKTCCVTPVAVKEERKKPPLKKQHASRQSAGSQAPISRTVGFILPQLDDEIKIDEDPDENRSDAKVSPNHEPSRANGPCVPNLSFQEFHGLIHLCSHGHAYITPMTNKLDDKFSTIPVSLNTAAAPVLKELADHLRQHGNAPDTKARGTTTRDRSNTDVILQDKEYVFPASSSDEYCCSGFSSGKAQSESTLCLIL